MPSPKTPPFDPPPRLNLGTFNEPLVQQPKAKPEAFDKALLAQMGVDPRLLESPHSKSPDRKAPPPPPKPYASEYYPSSPKPAENPLPSQIPNGIAATADYSTPKSDSHLGFSIGYSPPMPKSGSKSIHSGLQASESASESGGVNS